MNVTIDYVCETASASLEVLVFIVDDVYGAGAVCFRNESVSCSSGGDFGLLLNLEPDFGDNYLIVLNGELSNDLGVDYEIDVLCFSDMPSMYPSSVPTSRPTTDNPSKDPTGPPTTRFPSSDPSLSPTIAFPRKDPTGQPTNGLPSFSPTTAAPITGPTGPPTTGFPSSDPSLSPTTAFPSKDPT
eukprot:scaffold328038_cov71-Attheya_sp.AAC.1